MDNLFKLNLPPPKSIRSDMDQLKQMKNRCVQVIRAYRGDIKGQKLEQEKLILLLKEHPKEYDQEAMERNIKDCDKNIATFKKVIESERSKIKQLDHVLKDLEKRLCQSEAMYQ